MDAHGGESPTRKANARRHVVHADVIPYIKDNKMIKTVSDLLLSLKSREQELLKQYDIVKHPGIIGDMYEGLTKGV